MKKNAALFPAIAVALLSGCSILDTSFDYDTGHDFSGLKTYGWIEKQDGSIEARRARDAVDAALKARGFQPTDARPDFQVAAYVSTQDRIRVVDWGYNYHPRGRWYGGRDLDVWQYEEGSLVVDVIDPGQSALLWRGTASKAIDSTWTPEERDAEARKAASALIAEFPPKK